MRSILIMVLALTLAAVPVAQAQQIPAAAPAEQAVPILAEVPLPRIQVDPSPVTEIRLQQESGSADAMREVSARNALAVIGGILVVVALVALLR